MILARSSRISEIDRFAEETLGISTIELMKRSGSVIANTVRSRVPAGARIIILAGKGNNGGDGYAAAVELMSDYDIMIYDIFSAGQKNACGKYFLTKFTEAGGRVANFELSDEVENCIKAADCIIDAIFGTGFSGDTPEIIAGLSRIVNETKRCVKIAVDVPIGVNADTGSVNTTYACNMNATVVLSFIKPGLVSFPAKSYVGQIVFDNLGLPIDRILSSFSFSFYYVDAQMAKAFLPHRADNSNKGSFGKLLCITGSKKYRGAAALSLEAALRGGVGYVTYVGDSELCDMLTARLPEAIYRRIDSLDTLTDEQIEVIAEMSEKHTATLVGSGSGDTDSLFRLCKRLLSVKGGPLILDADAINVLARNSEVGLALIRGACRTVILTPHPLEFSRLCNMNVSDIQLHRIEAATKFAAENRCILVLKGAGTITTDGKEVYINSSGSSALAKAGSGDVLAGFLAAVIASGIPAPHAAALAVYYHGMAADSLAHELSAFGVIPSDLPREIGKQIAES